LKQQHFLSIKLSKNSSLFFFTVLLLVFSHANTANKRYNVKKGRRENMKHFYRNVFFVALMGTISLGYSPQNAQTLTPQTERISHDLEEIQLVVAAKLAAQPDNVELRALHMSLEECKKAATKEELLVYLETIILHLHSLQKQGMLPNTFPTIAKIVREVSIPRKKNDNEPLRAALIAGGIALIAVVGVAYLLITADANTAGDIVTKNYHLVISDMINKSQEDATTKKDALAFLDQFNKKFGNQSTLYNQTYAAVRDGKKISRDDLIAALKRNPDKHKMDLAFRNAFVDAVNKLAEGN